MVTEQMFFDKIKEVLSAGFDIPSEDITMDSNLVDDFELDSIDAAELVVKFKEYLPPKIDASMFREMRTVRDLVNLLSESQK